MNGTDSQKKTTGDGEGPDILRTRTIPPDAQAVRRAMAEPARPRWRMGPLVGIVLLLAVCGAFLFPHKPSAPPQQAIPERFGEPTQHDEGFRFLLQLEPDPGQEHGAELECMVVFTYSSLEGELEQAHQAIKDNWTATSKLMSERLGKHTRREFVHNLESINEILKHELTASLFPAGRGHVERVGWSYMKFR